jgi:hypothetical protein
MAVQPASRHPPSLRAISARLEGVQVPRDCFVGLRPPRNDGCFLEEAGAWAALRSERHLFIAWQREPVTLSAAEGPGESCKQLSRELSAVRFFE